MKTDWNAFKDDVRAVLTTEEPVPVKKNLWLIALLVLAISLAITIAFSDSDTKFKNPVSSNVPIEKTEKTDEIQKLKQEMANIAVKVRVLGVSHNNNWSSYNSRSSSNDLVFLEQDWKMNQIPPNIQKNESDTAFFQEWSNQ